MGAKRQEMYAIVAEDLQASGMRKSTRPMTQIDMATAVAYGTIAGQKALAKTGFGKGN